MPLRQRILKAETLETRQEDSEFDRLYSKVETLGISSFELAKLKSIEASSSVATSLISVLSVTVMVVFFVTVLNIGVALWLGDLLGKLYYGFFILSGFYFIVGLILYFFLRGWIQEKVSRLIITKALS
jgi:hypothetical protein